MLRRKALSIAILLAASVPVQLLYAQIACARGFGGRGFDRGDSAHADTPSESGGRGPFDNIDRSYYGDHAGLAAPVRGPAGVNGFHGDAVRHSYYDHHCFDRDWWAAHHYSYYYPWMGGSYCWGCTGWPMLAGFWGMSAADYPADYNYGTTITYKSSNVYYGSQQKASAAEYTTQANNLATSVAPLAIPKDSATAVDLSKIKPEDEKDWKPLGVFSLVQGGQTDSSKLFQLMVNKEGHIRGNYYDVMTDEVKPITGAVDKTSMRAAWKIDGVKDVVYDTGMSNLLKQDSPVLIHFGKEETQQWNLVRLEQPGKTPNATDALKKPS